MTSRPYSPLDDAERLALQSRLCLRDDLTVLDPILDELARDHVDVDVLDAGCASGIAGRARFDRDHVRVLGVDVAAPALERARQSPAGRFSYEVGELGEPRDRRFDLVFSALTLHLVPDPHVRLERLWDQVAPGGWLVVRASDFALAVTYPQSAHTEEIERLTAQAWPGVHFYDGRLVAHWFAQLRDVERVGYRPGSISTFESPGVRGRREFFEVLHGWKTNAVPSGEPAAVRRLEGLLEHEREHFEHTEGLFAATHQLILSGRRRD